MYREKIQNNDDNDDEDDDNNDHGDCHNGCEVGRGMSLVKKRKEHASILEGDTSREKKLKLQQFKQTNMDIFGMKVNDYVLMEIWSFLTWGNFFSKCKKSC